MKITVESPVIDGDTVTFRWSQSEANPYQSVNGFYLRYEGIDLAQFSASLFYEVFLALQLKVFATYGTPVDVVFPEPITRSTVAFWSAYHDAEHVTISPIAEVTSYSPWRTTRPADLPSRRAAVFFGGGKDSMLSTSLLSEIYGKDDVVLLQFVHPRLRGQVEMERYTGRQENLMFRPAREQLGLTTQRAWTDYLVGLRISTTAARARPHLEIYSAGFLPALLWWGATVCTPGLSRTSYLIRTKRSGRDAFRYPLSRPEALADQSKHYQRVLGADLTVTDTNIHFSPLMSFRLLAERYPDALARIVMCVSTPGEERWCYDCKKCAEYAFFSLRCGTVDPGFDYDAFFAKSAFIARILEYAESGVDLSEHGNAPWQSFLGAPTHYQTLCHTIAQIQPALISGRFGRKAFANFLVVKALLGNTSFPSIEVLTTQTRDLVGTDLADAIVRIASEHFPTVDELPGPFLLGPLKATYNFALRMPTRTEHLDHIKA